MKSTKSKQTERILELLQSKRGKEVPMPIMSTVGSGNPNGWCASFSRRISDARELIESGEQIVCRREIAADGSHHTFYTLKTI